MINTEQPKVTKKRKSINRNTLLGFFLANIPLFGFFIFGFIPLILSIVIGFHSPTGYKFEGMTYVGFDNYRTVLTDPLFFKSILNTLYSMLSIPIVLVISVIVSSMLIQPKIKGRSFFRTVFFIPYVCSVVAVSIMWKWVLDGEFGILNTLLSYVGINGPDWLGNSKTLMPAMIIMAVWSGLGFNIILFSAALTNVDPVLYEAAEIDGAGTVAKFLNVTLPSISPVTFYLLSIAIIGGLQDFARFQIMAPGGGPDNAGMTVVYYLYNRGFQNVITYGMGIASAVAWILTIMIVTITGLNFKLSKKWVNS